MKQPHIYTLPEPFIKDPSVPLKWKLYTLINGFWIAGKPVFASNGFFAEKLGCSERHIQDCLAELEKQHLLTRHGKSQNRRIIPGGRTDSSWGDEPRVRGRDEPRVRHISDSISVSNTASADFQVVDESKPVKEKSVPKDKSALALREKCYSKFESETGVRPTPTFADYSRVLEAQKVLKDSDILDMIDDALSKGRVKTVREALTARAIDIYRQEYA